MNDSVLRKAFIDICRGYSATNWNKTPVYIKHFSHFEQLDVELEREKFFQIARDKKIPTLEEQNKWLIKEGLWSSEDDKNIRDQKEYIEGLVKNRGKQAIKFQIDNYNKLIDESQTELNKLLRKKENLIGLTAENYAEQKMHSSYLFYGFFKDSGLKEKLFTEKQYKRLDDEESDELMGIYLDYIQTFSHSNIKKISIAQFFTSYFYLSEDFTKFFNKPLCDLTYNQVNLINYGSYFRRIIASLGDGIPPEIKDDPEKIESFVNRKNNIKENPNGKNGRKSYIGATEKDDGALIGGIKDDTLNKPEINTAWEDARKRAGIK